MAILTATPTREIATALPNNVVPASNPLSALEAPVAGVLGAIKSNAAAADQVAQGQSLAALDRDMAQISNDVALGTESPLVQQQRQMQSNYSKALSQSSAGKGALADLLMQERVRGYYQSHLNAGDITGATKSLELFHNYTGVNYGSAERDIVDKYQIKQEKIAEQTRTVLIKVLEGAGRTDLSLAYDDPTKQDEISKVLVEQDAITQNTQMLELASKRVAAIQGQLNLTKDQTELQNQKSLSGPVQGLALTGISYISAAIASSVARPLDGKDADPELVSAQVSSINNQFNDLEVQLNAYNLPGMSSVHTSTMALLKTQRADAIAAATNSEAAKAMQLKNEFLKNKSAADMPKAMRDSTNMLPFLHAAAALAASPLAKDPRIAQLVMDMSVNFVDTLRAGRVPTIVGSLPADAQLSPQLAVATKAIQDNIKLLGADPTSDAAQGMVGYMIGAIQDTPKAITKDRVELGSFVAKIIADPKALAAFQALPKFNTQQNQAALLHTISYAERDVTEAMKNSLAEKDSLFNGSLPIKDLVTPVVNGNTIIFKPQLSPAALKSLEGSDVGRKQLEYAAARQASKLQAQYGNVYKNIAQAKENLVGKEPPAPAATKQATVEKAAPAISQSILDKLAKLSPADLADLEASITPAE